MDYATTLIGSRIRMPREESLAGFFGSRRDRRDHDQGEFDTDDALELDDTIKRTNDIE